MLKRCVSAVLALLLLMGCASAVGLPPAGTSWQGGENYGGAHMYTLYITENDGENFGFELSILRTALYDDCGASLDWDGNVYFTVCQEEVPVMGGEVILFDDPNALALRFDFSIADYPEDLAGQTILFERT